MCARWIPLGLFGLVFAAFAYIHQGTGASGHNTRYDVLHAIVLHGTLSIDAYQKNTTDKAMYNGHWYSEKAPFTTIASIPAFYLSARLVDVLGLTIEKGKGWDIGSWITTAGSVGLLAALGVLPLYYLAAYVADRRTALVTAVTLSLGAMPIVYSTMLYDHGIVLTLIAIAVCALEIPFIPPGDRPQLPLWTRLFLRRTRPVWQSLLLVAAIAGVLRLSGVTFGRSANFVCDLAAAIAALYVFVLFLRMAWHMLRLRGMRPLSVDHLRDLLAGLSIGLAFATEFTAAPACAAIVALAAAHGWKRAVRVVLWAMLPALLVPAYNWAVFGSPLSISYQYSTHYARDHDVGFYGITFPPSIDKLSYFLISPRKGLFFWTPFLLLIFLGYGDIRRRFPRLFWLSVLGPLLQIIAIGGYIGPSAISIGPRYLSAIVPFLAIPAAAGFRRFPHLGLLLAGLSIFLTGFSTAVGSRLYPPIGNPFFGFYLPNLLKGTLYARNLGKLVGLRGIQSLLPLIFLLAIGLRSIWVRLEPRPLLAPARRSSPHRPAIRRRTPARRGSLRRRRAV